MNLFALCNSYSISDPSGNTYGHSSLSKSPKSPLPRPQTPRSTLEAPSTGSDPVPAPTLERSHAHCQFGGAVAGFVTGFGCRVLLTGARALERWFAVRQVFGVLLSRQTSGFDRAPGEFPITTTVLSALATCQLEAVLPMAARFSETMVVGHRCVVSTRVEQKSIDPSKKRPR
jgi:hypothetical protein